MAAAARLRAGGPASLARFRGALVGAVLGDCVGGEFEGAEDVPMERVLQHLNGLEQDDRGDGILQYSDDTAMTRCVVQSLLTRGAFDQHDLAHRFAEEYRHAPGRGYGSGVIQVLRRLSSPRLTDVYQPARAQFGGRGSFGNGGAMRAAPFALAFSDPADIKRYSRLGAMLTHSCALGYNGAVLQALAVHLALQGALAVPQAFINSLISEMEDAEAEDHARSDARALNEPEFPYCTRLHKVKELMEKSTVSIEEVISELGNGIAALHSVPTAIFCVLHCLEPQGGLPDAYGGLQRTLAYCLALGGDTDTIACMAGAIAGAHYGIEAIPPAWQRCCEGAEEAEVWAEHLHQLYQRSPRGGDSESAHTDT
ncbi:ADP-ribosylhydrolase ARH3 isoform X1 [Paramormyrops kingsleyae]|uniref:ADP-ribosylhydrolase ARH3 n=2 Tax=Paramormyrops kingsleyae TaxID=1676925 RepID=A0A3B3QX39_9TELE|nr:poly(ADP-ribose) glycohydrolase ARH3 isoform X1 [Paramormyrops kingsleyae]